jgi:hypothetical protein
MRHRIDDGSLRIQQLMPSGVPLVSENESPPTVDTFARIEPRPEGHEAVVDRRCRFMNNAWLNSSSVGVGAGVGGGLGCTTPPTLYNTDRSAGHDPPAMVAVGPAGRVVQDSAMPRQATRSPSTTPPRRRDRTEVKYV